MISLRSFFSWLVLALAVAGGMQTVGAQTSESGKSAAADPRYRLSSGDEISISVYNEPDLSAVQIIGRDGEVKLPLIGEIVIGGQTVRDTERLLEAAYKDREFLRKPVVNLAVTSYVPREVSVLGAVRNPGIIGFPRDVTSFDIVEIITKAGGFLPIAKASAVTLTRRTAEGREVTQTVDLDAAMSGRRKSGTDRGEVLVYPGDRIWVPETLF